MIIAVDFDGTCVTHEYPHVGKDIGATPFLKALVESGHQLMLWTMRSNKPVNGVDTLADAVKWFEANGIPLWGINENPEQQETLWSNSNKQYAALYIDDAALGCPLIFPVDGGRPYADWIAIGEFLAQHELIPRIY